MSTDPPRRAAAVLAACLLALAPLPGATGAQQPQEGIEPPAHDEGQIQEESPPAEKGGAAGSVESGMRNAGEATESGLKRAGEATGEALDKALKATGEGVGYVIDKTGKGFQKAGEALSGEPAKE